MDVWDNFRPAELPPAAVKEIPIAWWAQLFDGALYRIAPVEMPMVTSTKELRIFLYRRASKLGLAVSVRVGKGTGLLYVQAYQHGQAVYIRPLADALPCPPVPLIPAGSLTFTPTLTRGPRNQVLIVGAAPKDLIEYCRRQGYAMAVTEFSRDLALATGLQAAPPQRVPSAPPPAAYPPVLSYEAQLAYQDALLRRDCTCNLPEHTHWCRSIAGGTGQPSAKVAPPPDFVPSAPPAIGFSDSSNLPEPGLEVYVPAGEHGPATTVTVALRDTWLTPQEGYVTVYSPASLGPAGVKSYIPAHLLPASADSESTPDPGVE